MNIAVPINGFNINNVFFQESIKNTIMDNSSFSRVIYSTDFFICNGICRWLLVLLFFNRIS